MSPSSPSQTAEPGPAPPRSALAGTLFRAAALAAGLAVLVSVDRLVPSGGVSVDGLWDRAFFRETDAYEPGGFRLLEPGSVITLRGLGSGAQVLVTITVAAAPQKTQTVEVVSGGEVVHRGSVDGRGAVWSFEARADLAGRLRLRFEGERRLRVFRLEARQAAGAAVPWGRWAQYAGLLVVAMALAARVRRRRRAEALAVALATAALVGAMAWSRLLVLAYLGWLVAGLATATVLFGAALALRVPRSSALVVSVVLGGRLLVALHPAFPEGDLLYHAHKLIQFQQGGLLEGRFAVREGRELLAIPYPPAFYAVLSPLVGRDVDEDAAAAAVRPAMALLEATVPLLLILLMRAGGASAEAAGAAAMAASVMPEGLLVLVKAVAANITGSWLALLVVWAVLRRAPGALVAALSAAAFLGHPGSAVCLAGLLALWMAREASQGRRGWSEGAVTLAFAALGAVLAWAAYYRHVSGLTLASLRSLESWRAADASSFFEVRWVHLGKVLQNLVLKFGGAPLALAILGLRSPSAPAVLRGLLLAWLAVAAVLGLLAVATPFAVRFEYFASPAVAMAAGLGAEECRRRGRRRAVGVAFGAALLVQTLIAAFALLGRFHVIAVILPSPRWPFPFRL